MAKPGTLVVSHYNPAQALRQKLLLACIWIATLAGVYWFCKSTMTPNFAKTQAQLSQTQRDLLQSQNNAEALKIEISKHQRGEQVAKESNNSLQTALNDKQSEINTLRADLAFFHRFAGGGNADALGVQDITITATDNPRVFKYAIAVSQNLNRGKVAAGKLRFTVTGISETKAKKLEMSSLLGEGGAKELRYEFKYFQLFNGTLYLPEKFSPSAIRARMQNDDGEAADKEVTWEAAIKAAAGVQS